MELIIKDVWIRTRSPMMEAKGLAKEARGKVQKNVGDMRARSDARNDKKY